LDEANILPNEKVAIWNITNGARLETYALPEERGSRRFLLNGAAARLGAVGDMVIIVTFAEMEEAEAQSHRPIVLLMNQDNEIVERR
jgi:aspartate 1-decarboxylase